MTKREKEEKDKDSKLHYRNNRKVYRTYHPLKIFIHIHATRTNYLNILRNEVFFKCNINFNSSSYLISNLNNIFFLCFWESFESFL